MAPAGYGKTSLACEWLESDPDAGWLRCTSALADVAAFSVALAEAVGHIAPNAADRLRQRLTVPDSPEAAVRPLAEMLAEELAQWPATGWLVIDDYHLVMASATVDEFMDLLLEACPVNVLATSRRRPSWATARRRLQGEVLEIPTDALAMTGEEAAEVLEGRSSENVQRLVTLAEGWPAVIGLAAITESEQLPPAEVASELYRYFAEEVLQHESPNFQEPLLKAAILPAIDSDICRQVLGVHDPRAFLTYLLSSGLATEIEPNRVAIHPLLKDFLLHRLTSIDPRSEQSVRAAALAYARHEGRWSDAFELMRCEDNASAAASLVAEAADDLLRAGQIEMLESWLLESGAEAEHHAATRLARAEVFYRRRRLSDAEALAREIATTGAADDPTISRAWCLAGRAAHVRSRSSAAREFHLSAESTALTEVDRSNALWGLFLASLELEEGVDGCLEGLLQLEPTTDLHRVRIAMAQTMRALTEGRVRCAYELVSLSEVRLRHLPDPVVRSGMLMQFAHVEALRGDYQHSYELAKEALQVCTAFRIEFAYPFCLCGYALAVVGKGQMQEARRLCLEVGKYTTESGDPYLATIERCLKLRIALVDRDLRWASRLSKQPPPQDIPRPTRGELLGLSALAAACCEDMSRARQLCDEACAVTVDRTVQLLARLVKVVIHDLEKRPVQAQEVEHILKAVLDQEAVDPFVMTYRTYPQILRTISAGGVISPGLELLLRRMNDLQLVEEAGLEPGSPDIPVREHTVLTPRETEVLDLLRLGLSNREIALRLYIAESTAKVHVRNVLEKLGVRTRLQAALLSDEDIGRLPPRLR